MYYVSLKSVLNSSLFRFHSAFLLIAHPYSRPYSHNVFWFQYAIPVPYLIIFFGTRRYLLTLSALQSHKGIDLSFTDPGHIIISCQCITYASSQLDGQSFALVNETVDVSADIYSFFYLLWTVVILFVFYGNTWLRHSPYFVHLNFRVPKITPCMGFHTANGTCNAIMSTACHNNRPALKIFF